MKKKLHEGMRGGGGVLKLGMCNKCPVYFQLSIVTWLLIGFHGNHSNIITSSVAAILDFQIF